MIVAAAICPSAPLLADQLTGPAEVLPELRAACSAAVESLLGAEPDLLVIAGPSEATARWDPAGELSLAAFAPALRGAGRQPATAPALPLALGIGALLLDQAGYAGPRTLQGIAQDASASACAELGEEIAVAAPRVALLAVGDGSARRSLTAPGYLDDRAGPFDEEVARAVGEADLPAIAALDPVLAADLLAVGRPAWQALAGALAAGRRAADRPQARVLYSDAPLGVAYLVAIVTP